MYNFGGQSYKYPDHFETVIIPDDGLCYTFNPNGTLFQYRAGANHGLSIRLFINTSVYLCGNGVGMSFRNQGEFAFPSIDGIGISPGFSSFISIKKRTVIRKEAPYTSKMHTRRQRMLMLLKYWSKTLALKWIPEENTYKSVIIAQ